MVAPAHVEQVTVGIEVSEVAGVNPKIAPRVRRCLELVVIAKTDRVRHARPHKHLAGRRRARPGRSFWPATTHIEPVAHLAARPCLLRDRLTLERNQSVELREAVEIEGARAKALHELPAQLQGHRIKPAKARDNANLAQDASSGRGSVRNSVAIIPIKTSVIVASKCAIISTKRDALHHFQKQNVWP